MLNDGIEGESPHLLASPPAESGKTKMMMRETRLLLFRDGLNVTPKPI